MTRWSAITRTRGRRCALAYGSRSTTAAEDNLNRLVHHERGRYRDEQGRCLDARMAAAVPAAVGRGGPGDEARVVDAFCRWLEAEGWSTTPEVEFADALAERGSERLYIEAKGRTSSAGLDVDTLYGQLLR